MTAAEKILTGAYFLLFVPVIMMIAPPAVCMSVIGAGTIIYICRTLCTRRYRCSNCGDIFSLGISGYLALLTGTHCCPTCKEERRPDLVKAP